MAKLTVNELERHGKLRTMRIGGFVDGELSELKSMDYYEAKDKLLEMLDYRNDGIGTCWACGYGTFGLWFDNEFAYLNIGTSCD